MLLRLREVIWGLASLSLLVPLATFSQDLTARAPAQLPLSKATLASDARRAWLVRLDQSLKATHEGRILVIGSSSTVGLGASSPSRTYVARLEPDLEAALKGTDFVVIGHGMSGEVAQGAADRMKREVEDAKPDLVIWQVGTNDAMGHVPLDKFKSCLKKTLAWLAEQHVDVVLLNPQYGDVLIKDAYYEEVVAVISDIAREANVLLVDRFDAMRKLTREHADKVYLSADNLHMNDEGYRRLAEQIAVAIVAALPHEAKSVASN
jgi:lysophospholipase L1-like esterase